MSHKIMGGHLWPAISNEMDPRRNINSEQGNDTLRGLNYVPAGERVWTNRLYFDYFVITPLLYQNSVKIFL